MTEERDVRALAGKVGAQASLKDIHLRRIKAELGETAAEGPYEVTLSVQPSYEEADSLVAYRILYTLEATGEQEDVVLTGTFEFSALYELPSEHGFSERALTAFGEVSVLFSVHPYLREVVQSMTIRLGLPPLVLDVLRSPLHPLPEDDGTEG